MLLTDKEVATLRGIWNRYWHESRSRKPGADMDRLAFHLAFDVMEPALVEFTSMRSGPQSFEDSRPSKSEPRVWMCCHCGAPIPLDRVADHVHDHATLAKYGGAK